MDFYRKTTLGLFDSSQKSLRENYRLFNVEYLTK